MPENKEKEKKTNETKQKAPSFSFGNYSSVYAPGKKGGTYDLPMCGKLIIPEGAMNKKDHVTAGVICASNRFIYTPNMSIGEKLLSEIYKLDASYKHLKNPIFLQIPYKEIDTRIYEINVRGLWSHEEEWVDVGFLGKKDEKNDFQTYAELTLHKGGVFAVTCIPKKETFELTTNGSIFSSRLCRYFSLRCPRKAVDSTVHCSLEVIPIPPEKLVYCHDNYELKCSDLLDCYEMVDVCCSQTSEFRRPLTLKMPIPCDSIQPNEAENEVLKTCDIAVLMKESPESEWDLLENMRISRRMVSFDSKKLGRFCVVKVKKGRIRRMKEAITILEDKCHKVAGCISMFVMFEEKLWTVAVACYPREESDSYEKEWEKRQFEKINPRAKKDPEKTTHFDIPGKRSQVYKFNDAELFDGLSWTVNLEGSFNIVNNTEEQESKLTFHSHLREHFFICHVEPVRGYLDKLVGNLSVTPDDINDEEERSKLTGLFTVSVSQEIADKYFHVEPEPEVEDEEKRKPALKRIVSCPPTDTIEAPKIKRDSVSRKSRKVSQTGSAMERLTKCVRKANIISREARVLSGRSLMVLSHYVPNGLKLAMHLGLSESCITGLGFDALANGLNMNDITYKILLYWKRHIKMYDTAVQELALAFTELGLPHVGNIIINLHAEGAEITKSCFAFMEM